MEETGAQKEGFKIENKDGKPIVIDPIVYDMNKLRQISEPTTMKQLEIINLKERIIRSMNFFGWVRGYGLAAIQIGIPLRAAWFKVKYKDGTEWEKTLCNPEVISTEGVFYLDQEGCLSIPHKRVTTKRYRKIKIKNGDGEIIEAEGLEAVILQHEIDHMNGILCIDHACPSKDIPGRNEPCPCGSGKKFKKCCPQ